MDALPIGGSRTRDDEREPARATQAVFWNMVAG